MTSLSQNTINEGNHIFLAEDVDDAGAIGTLSDFAKSLVRRANSYINQQEDMVPVIKEMMLKCLNESGCSIAEVDDKRISTEALTIWAKNSNRFPVVMGHMKSRNNLMEFCTETRRIHFDFRWLSDIFDMQRTNLNLLKRKQHTTLFVLKLLHEYAHGLTADIMDFVRSVQSEQRLSLSPAETTHAKLRTIVVKGKLVGDMGHLMEEILLGIPFARCHLAAKGEGRCRAILVTIASMDDSGCFQLSGRPGAFQMLNKVFDPSIPDQELPATLAHFRVPEIVAPQELHTLSQSHKRRRTSPATCVSFCEDDTSNEAFTEGAESESSAWQDEESCEEEEEEEVSDEDDDTESLEPAILLNYSYPPRIGNRKY
jgi:hypothetical protein